MMKKDHLAETSFLKEPRWDWAWVSPGVGDRPQPLGPRACPATGRAHRAHPGRSP